MSLRKIFLSREAVGALLIGIFGAIMLALTRDQFGLYPIVVFSAMILVCVVVLACLLSGRMAANALILPNRYELLFILILIASLPLMKPLGFYTAGALALYALAMLTSRNFTPRGFGRALLYVICVTAGVYLIFTLLLKIPTPVGLFL